MGTNIYRVIDADKTVIFERATLMEIADYFHIVEYHDVIDVRWSIDRLYYGEVTPTIEEVQLDELTGRYLEKTYIKYHSCAVAIGEEVNFYQEKLDYLKKHRRDVVGVYTYKEVKRMLRLAQWKFSKTACQAIDIYNTLREYERG